MCSDKMRSTTDRSISSSKLKMIGRSFGNGEITQGRRYLIAFDFGNSFYFPSTFVIEFVWS